MKTTKTPETKTGKTTKKVALQDVLDAVMAIGKATTKAVAEHLNVQEDTVREHLAKGEKEGFLRSQMTVERVGKKPPKRTKVYTALLERGSKKDGSAAPVVVEPVATPAVETSTTEKRLSIRKAGKDTVLSFRDSRKGGPAKPEVSAAKKAKEAGGEKAPSNGGRAATFAVVLVDHYERLCLCVRKDGGSKRVRAVLRSGLPSRILARRLWQTLSIEAKALSRDDRKARWEGYAKKWEATKKDVLEAKE